MTFFFILLCTLIEFSLSCDVEQSSSLNFSTSTQDRVFFPYSNDGEKDIIPYFRVSNCSKSSASSKFLMVSFGPQNQQLSDRIKAYDISNQSRDNGCSIKNSPFKVTEDYPTRKKYLDEKWHAIRSCYEIVVTDEGTDIINFPLKQPGCQYRFESKNKISFNGGFCFFKPDEMSSYRIQYRLKDDCLDYEGLKKLNVKVTDFQSALNFYTSGDPTGTSLELTSIKSFPIRFSVSPFEKIISPSDKYNTISPIFPRDYYLADTHLGSPEATRSRPGFIKLRLPLWTYNKCTPTCYDGYCQGLCDYSQPLVGQVELYELDQGRQNNLEINWFQGGVALPRFQGEISGTTFELSEESFPIGKNFRIIMRFSDPKLDFENLKKNIRSKIENRSPRMGQINSSGIPKIPEIPVIQSSLQIPEMVTIEELNFSKRINDSFLNLMTTFSNYFNYKYWPPYFDQVCTQGRCLPVGDDYLVLGIDFKVESFDMDSNKFSLKVTNVKRNSPLLEEYSKNDPSMPFIFCQR